jgi:polyhydroxybutyrate depolymerase
MPLRLFFCALILAAFVFSPLNGLQEPSAAEAHAVDEIHGKLIEKSIMVNGMERWYRLYLPQRFDQNAGTVVLLHGGTQSMRKIFRRGAGGAKNWLHISDRQGFLLIVPNGVNPKTGDAKGDKQQWNDLRGEGPGRFSTAADVGFITQLLRALGKEYGFAKNRVFVTGASNGGMLTYRLLIEAPEYFAAGAAFIANLPKAMIGRLANPSKPTPLMIMNGTQDRVVPWSGGQVARNRGEVLSAAETVAWWVKVNRAALKGSSPMALKDLAPDDGCRIFLVKHAATGKNSAPVYFYTMQGAGHAMPSVKYDPPEFLRLMRIKGPVCKDAEGSELAWNFFQKHSGAVR